MCVDPLAHKYPSLSPYNYAENCPLMIIDPDGRGGFFYGFGAAAGFGYKDGIEEPNFASAELIAYQGTDEDGTNITGTATSVSPGGIMGAAVGGKAVLGSGKLINLKSLSGGKFEVLSREIVDGEVVKSLSTSGTAEQLGIKNIQELAKKGGSYVMHFLQKKE